MKLVFRLSSLLLVAVLAPGCDAVPGDGGTPGGVDSEAARAALCDTATDTSLGNLAAQVEAMTDETDPTAMGTAIGSTMADLQALRVEPGEAVPRDAAVTALGQLQGALSDGETRRRVATQAAYALRAAQMEIC
ncbi:MAG TPA: hypothetical protein VMP67_05835 [Candidatus Limnocylindria bacterium]|nr:hypothetical protein [Candidatus Limnocylindria bacterium]